MKKHIIGLKTFILPALVLTLIISLSQVSHSRGPAVEELPQMDLAEMERAEKGESFSTQNEALKNGAGQRENPSQRISSSKNSINESWPNIGFTALILAFLILLPMGLSYVIIHSKYGERIEYGEVTSTGEALGLDDNVVELSKYRGDQDESQDDPNRKKAS